MDEEWLVDLVLTFWKFEKQIVRETFLNDVWSLLEFFYDF